MDHFNMSGPAACTPSEETETQVVDGEILSSRWSGTLKTQHCACGATRVYRTVTSGNVRPIDRDQWSAWHHRDWPHNDMMARI